VARTADGGETWELIHNRLLQDNSAVLYCLWFFDTDTGLVGGDGRSIYRTEDGGDTWQWAGEGATFINAIVTDIFFIDDSTGWFCDMYLHDIDNHGVINKSKDKGITWNTIERISYLPYTSLFFPSDSIGYASGFFGGIEKTFDGGENWSLYWGRYYIKNLNSLYFFSNDTGWAVGNEGIILNIINGSREWYIIDVNTTENLNDIAFIDRENGWIVGSNGSVLRYSRTTNVDGPNVALPHTFAFHHNFPNPFNAGTVIQFDIPESGFITLSVYDLLGREIDQLVSEYKTAGRHIVHYSPVSLPSGTYFLSLQYDQQVRVITVTYLK
jgi:hypothetical protein